MLRRDFSLGLGSVALGAGPAAWAQGKTPVDGGEFISLDRPAPTEGGAGKVDVVEFFWYSCPHCNAFEPQLEAWLAKLPKHVHFRRVPVMFRPNFEPQQRLFYVLEALGRLEDLHKKVFYAIHVDKQTLDSPESIATWLSKQGVERAKFLEQYNSFAVTTKARRATQWQEQYKVDGVPSLGIAGRYYTSGSLAGTMQRALQVTDYLVGQIAKGAKI
ncbi:MAG: thiol:disulfide interchange protein DsbA/DsbL [Betaproteobacteria bacterium]